MHPYEEFVNPHLGKLLRNVGMDKRYIQGEGCILYDEEGNAYLDCIAAYGALPFGYNPSEIWQCILEYHQSGEPSFIQPSALNAAGDLARALIDIAPQGLKYVTFTNSGTESVEAAIKLCRSATGRKGILATTNSFHGKTLGALSATGKRTYQSAFGAPIEGFTHIPYGDLDALALELDKNPEFYAAFLIEPIQGEGGIIEPPKGYLKEAKALCEKYGVLFVADEIQTGLGRTGCMFACEEENVTPDVLLLAKALGGGLFPIGACISTEEVYNEEFAIKHSSTFAGNSLGCRIGLKVLELLTRDDQILVKTVRAKGEKFKRDLLKLKEQYPEILRAVRGRGLMLGIDFGINQDTFPHGLLGVMAEQELLTPVISSYLLNCEGLRVAPTLNGSSVIRIEPPLTITEEQWDKVIYGIQNVLQILREKNTAKLLSFMFHGKDERSYRSTPQEKIERIAPSGNGEEGRFAFLVHPIDLKNYAEFDKSLSVLDEGELQQLADRWNDLVEPFVAAKTRITSKCGRTAYGEFITVPRTAEQLMMLPKQQVMEELKAAVKLAKDRGARIVGLGAYTSVASMGGLYLKDEGIPLTTGNSYTVVSAVDAVTTALNRLGMPCERTVTAMVGATGSIGRGVSMLMAERVGRMILIGNPANKRSREKRLSSVRVEILRYLANLVEEGAAFRPGSIGFTLASMESFPSRDASDDAFFSFARELDLNGHNPITITTAAQEALPLADVAICATNHVGQIITSENLKHGAIVCDMSRPSNVSEEIMDKRPDVLVIDGGVIEVPGLPSLGWDFGFDQGLAYACMAETMMLALEHHYNHTSLGSSGVNLESILFTKELADKHGFKLASFRSFDRPLSEEKWHEVIRSRMKQAI